MEIPTIKIKAQTENGYMIINAEDFDPKTMIEHDESEKTTETDSESKTSRNKKTKVTLEDS